MGGQDRSLVEQAVHHAVILPIARGTYGRYRSPVQVPDEGAMGLRNRRFKALSRALAPVVLIATASVALGARSPGHTHPDGAAVRCAVCTHASSPALPAKSPDAVPDPLRHGGKLPLFTTAMLPSVVVPPQQARAPPKASLLLR